MSASYKIIISDISYQKVADYQALLVAGNATAGSYLARQIAQETTPVAQMTTDAFLDLLLATKHPRIFAESEIRGEGKDWNDQELSILGDINVSADVKVFDNGVWSPTDLHFKTHTPPIDATLLFSPGALLAKGAGYHGKTPDMVEVAPNGVIDTAAYTALVERRLLPLLIHADERAAADGVKAVITIPGIGAGVFAGTFSGQMGGHLSDALQHIIGKHAARLQNIAMIYYDPFSECVNDDKNFGSMLYRVRPQKYNAGKAQLCAPQDYAEAGEDFKFCRLFKIVAWDHVSLPGNDFFGGSRHTDDGVAAGATDVMRAITGINVGQGYDAKTGHYLPPQGCNTWEDAAIQNGVVLVASGRVEVYGVDVAPKSPIIAHKKPSI